MTKFNKGDKVFLDLSGRKAKGEWDDFAEKWHGLECEVLYVYAIEGLGPRLQPLKPRPDEFGNNPFFWDYQEVKHVLELPSDEDYEVD